MILLMMMVMMTTINNMQMVTMMMMVMVRTDVRWERSVKNILPLLKVTLQKRNRNLELHQLKQTKMDSFGMKV